MINTILKNKVINGHGVRSIQKLGNKLFIYTKGQDSYVVAPDLKCTKGNVTVITSRSTTHKVLRSGNTGVQYDGLIEDSQEFRQLDSIWHLIQGEGDFCLSFDV